MSASNQVGAFNYAVPPFTKLRIKNIAAAYTVVANDNGTIINCTSGTFTISITAAATLGSGFNFTVINSGTGTVSINPNDLETIDGNSDPLPLKQGGGMALLCNGSNFLTTAMRTSGAISGGASNVQMGYSATASGVYSIAIGAAPVASADYSAAIGSNSSSGGSQAVTGAGAMALGGSYASGADSFAAAIASNSSSYGATGLSSTAIGNTNKATSGYNTAVGGYQNISSGNWSTTLGGRSCTAAFDYSIALGYVGTPNVVGKMAYGHASGAVAGLGWGILSLYAATTDATATVLTSSSSPTPGLTNQLILPNNSAYSFTGTVVARQKAANGTASAAWKVEGLIRREANAGTTTLVASTVTAISNVPGWTLALSADTTNGGLAITATGAAATNIRWISTIDTSEVIYA